MGFYVRGAEIFSDIGEFKKLFDLLKYDMNESENNQYFQKRNVFQTTKTEISHKQN